MTDFHVETVTVTKVEKHPNADRLSLAEVNGCPVIFQTEGGYKEGDLAVHVPVDAVVPAKEPFLFLFTPEEIEKGKSFRVKAKKLRGIFSMGLLVPVPAGAFVEGNDPQPGVDLATFLGVTRYEPEVVNPKLVSGESTSGPGIPVYDIEPLRKYSDLFEEGEEVWITEKIHGCVPYLTLISMVDGSRKRIGQIQEGEMVLGMSTDGQVVPSRVLHKFNNGPAGRWLKVVGQRRGSGRGSSFYAVRCTEEHRFWSPKQKEYVHARDLKPGDEVLMLRSDLALTPIQEQVLLGKLLGDGSLCETEHSASITWGHRKEDIEYARWTSKAIGASLDKGTENPTVSGYGTDMVRRGTVRSPWIKDKFSSFFAADADKQVPAWVEQALTPLALAFWYMDDGSLSHQDDQEDRANFAVCSFNSESCDVLIRGLARLGLEAEYYVADGYSRLRLNAESAERLFLLVAPYIPPCMQRKLPERYRGHEGWLPSTDSEFKSRLVPQTIQAIEIDPTVKSDRFDLETETHNYFAHGVLVHNCNSRFMHDGTDFHVGSHKTFKRDSEGNMWWNLARDLGLPEKLAARPNLAVYGEAYGQVQDLRYGKVGVHFAAFDVWDTQRGVWFDVDAFLGLMESLELPVVPTLYRGPWKGLEWAKEMAEGQSTLADHVREGIVVKPIKERWSRSVGRVFLKLAGQGYLLR